MNTVGDMDDLAETNANEYLLKDVLDRIASSLQCPQDDFIPKDYQSELANSTKTSNKTVFLPSYEDKLYVSYLILKSNSLEIEKSGKQIIYLIDSSKYLSTVTAFFTKHSHYPVIEIRCDKVADLWNTQNGQRIIVTTSSIYLNALSKWNSKLQDTFMIFFDDCAFAYGQNSMKQVMNYFQNCNEQDWPRVTAFTSCLLHPQIKADDNCMFEFLKNLEITFKSTIISSQYCNVTRKLLTRVNDVKFVKYRHRKENFEESLVENFHLDTLIGKTIALIDGLKLPNDSSVNEQTHLRGFVSRIFQDIVRYMYLYGMYPAFIVSNIHRIRLEKKKLLCDDITTFILSAIINDLYVIRSLIWDKIMENNTKSKENAATIVKNTSEKIVKLLSLLYKMDYNGNCIVLVNDCITARIITLILQKLSKCETKMGHILADFIISSESVLESNDDREQSFFRKQLNSVVQRFQKSLLSVLVISWKADFDFSELNSNWIVYFDLAPTFQKYILSRRFANDTSNNNYFFIEETGDEEKFNRDKRYLGEFVDLDLNLKELLSVKDLNNEYRLRKSLKKFKESKSELEDKFPPLITKHNKRLSFISAIHAVNKYCKSLPCDGFSSPAPRWSFQKKDGGVVCRVRLPIQSGIETVIENPPIKNVKFVKQIAALETVKYLYKCGQINDDLVSTFSYIDDQLNSEILFPNWIHEDESIKAGSAQCYRTVPLKFPEWLNQCCPRPDADTFLHIIHLKTAYEEPNDSRKSYFHKLMQSDKEFGILSSKKLPQLCEFPVYSDLGQVNVTIEVNAKIMKLTGEEVDKLLSCHKFIYLDVLQIVKGFLIGDRCNGDNSYCIVPLEPSDNGSMNIAWDVVNNLSIRSDIIEPSETERVSTHYSSNDFLGKVVTPWYRMLTQRYYIVTKVCTNLRPTSKFPSGEYDTFTEYYHEKYNLEVKNPIQPLLEARIITDNLKCIRPRAQNPGIKKKKGEKEPDLPVILLPEFCIRQSFPAVYWYKAVLLLGITHRLHYILLAEQLRRKVASEMEAIADSSIESDEKDVMIVDESFVKECEEGAKPVVPILSILKQVKYVRNVRRYPWADEQLPIDIDRQIDTVSMIEVMSYCDFIRGQTGEHPDMFALFAPSVAEFPKLKFIDARKPLNPGPKQTDIVQTFTGVNCDDIFNLERLKMMGKSFVNFAVSLWLYKSNPDWNVTQLRQLKQKILSRRNFYYCGAKLELGSYIKLHDFSENNDWFLSGFCVPDVLINILKNYVIPPEAIFNLEIPRDEQHSGEISAETRDKMQNKMIEYYDKTSTKNTESTLNKTPISDNGDHNHAFIYFKKHSVPDKAVASALKSLIGVYLTNTGVESTFKFLQYIGVLPKESHPDASYPSKDSPPNENHSYFDEDNLKETLGYEFKNKRLLTEAITHHSYFSETSTICNHKLAFLGDSILDLLLTGYVHEYGQDRKISEVREIRVSLMNDVVFAIVAVRIGLHKVLFYDSVRLMKKIDQFVQEENRVNCQVSYDELLFLIEETNNAVIDSVDVPRALTDVFKSIVAAIYLDTNGDLKTVWNVVHRVLKKEIDKFNDMPPRDPIKLLEETDLKFSFDPTTYGNLIIVPLQIEIDHGKKIFFGTGSSKNQAKRIAAKTAIKEMAREFVV
ncbi:endoribonuclease Dicer-like isoform X2 [Planococcus citri]|uniref:endoribonuclease Dicer-like isoform X2 n=1 Tax=Planococcus citri TaxID=170843 RepID=UPI0031F8ECF5